MSNTRKLSTSSKSTKFQPKLNSSFFLVIKEKKESKNFDYFFLQFLLYKKNLANNKLNLQKANFGKEKEQFSRTQQNLNLKVSEEKFSGHFLFLAPSNSLSTIALKGPERSEGRCVSFSPEVSPKFGKKESSVAFSNKAIKFSLAPGKSSSSFSPINDLRENFFNSTNKVLETKSIFRSAYNSSTVLLDSHTPHFASQSELIFAPQKFGKPFFYYWLLPFFGFLTNINPKDALTEKQNLTNFSIYPVTKNLNKQNLNLVEFDNNSTNFVNPTWELSSKNLENKSLLQNLLIFERKNWQQNFIEFSVLPSLNYQPSSSVSVVKNSVFKNVNNKTKVLPYKLSLFNTNKNIPQNLNSKIVLASKLSQILQAKAKLPQNEKRSVRVNKLPWESKVCFSDGSAVSYKKLNLETNYFVNSLTGISSTGKFTPGTVFVKKFSFLQLNKSKKNTITELNFRKKELILDFQKLNLFRINENIGDFSDLNFNKVFWNSKFKSAVKIKKNLNIFLNRKNTSLQNFSVKPNSYTQFVFNSLFSNFDNQNLLENEELKNFNSVLKHSIPDGRLAPSVSWDADAAIPRCALDPKLLKKSELNYLAIASLQNTLNTVKRNNSTKILPGLEAVRLEQNLRTINNLKSLKLPRPSVSWALTQRPSLRSGPNKESYNLNNFLYFDYFNSTTKSFDNKKLLGFNLLNSNILIKIKKPKNFVQPVQNFKKQFIKPILVNKAVYPAFNRNILNKNIKKVEAPDGASLLNQLGNQTKRNKLNFPNLNSNKLNPTDSNNFVLNYQNKSYNNNITYIESLKNQLKLTLTKQNFILKLRNQELILNKNGYLDKTEKLVRNFLVRNKAAYSNFSERKKIKKLSSLEFAENKKEKEAIFAFLKNQLRYSLSSIKNLSSASKFSKRPRKFVLKTSREFFVNNSEKNKKCSFLLAKQETALPRSGSSKINLNFVKSTNLILKNRSFLSRKKASYIYRNLNLVSSENFVKTKILEKRQKIAKKRKLKKQKKENRRRKKRKRFYPRPIWIRSRLYNFLRNKTNNTSTNKIIKTSANKNLFFNNIKFYNLDYSANIFNAENRKKQFSIFALANYSYKNLEKDLYTISRPVLGELKRVLWKSYWLRKNLNTYTTKIKKELRVLQEEQRKESLFETVSLIVKYLAGFESGFEPSVSWANANQFYSVSSNSTWQSAINLAEYNRLVYERMQKMIFSIRENLSSQEEMPRLRGRASGPERSEGRCVSSQLTLGHIIKQLNFAHPSFKSSTKFARAKQNSSDPNSNTENKDFWLKLGKTLTFELPQSPQAFYGNTKKNRMHWALSKTYKNFREINNNNLYFSKRKNLWSTGILREQSKANKTKKLLYNLTKNIYSGIKFVKNPNFSVTKDLGLPRIDYIYLSKIRKTEEKLGYFGFSSNLNNNKLKNKQNKNYRLLFENQSFKNITQNYSLPIQTSNYLNFNKKANNFADLQNTKNMNNNFSPDLANNLQPKSSSYITSQNLQKQYWWTFSDNNFFNFVNLFSFSSVSSINKVESQSNLVVYISSFLFHFCCLISLISISQIRGIIKFGLILVSKVTNVGNQIFNLLFSVCQFFDGKFGNLFNNFSTKTTSTSQLTTKSTYLIQNSILRSSKSSEKAKLIKLQNSIFSLEEKNINSSLLNKILTKTRETDYKQIFKSSFQNLTTSGETKKENLFSTKNLNSGKKIYYTVYLEYLLQKNVINPKNFQNLTKQSTNLSQKSELFKLVKKLQLFKLISFNSQKGYNSALFIYKVSNKVLEQILGTVTKTTAFFSRPGEFIGDWLAYLFLVEWSADLKTTIPDQIFQSYYLTLNKLARLTYSASALNLVKQNNFLKPINNIKIAEKESNISNLNNFYSLNNFSSILFSFAFSKLLQRRISVLFEDILEKFFQPDTDLLVRQRKSTIFWDIWGDYLVLVAEDSSINLSELTSLKEEQIKLLEILLTNSALYSAQKTNNIFIANLTQKLSNFSLSLNNSNQDSSKKRQAKLLDSQDLINYQKLEERMESKISLTNHLVRNKIGEAFFNSLNNNSAIYLQNKGASQFLRNLVNNNSFYKYNISNKLIKNKFSENSTTQLVKSKLVQKLSNTILTKEEKLKDFWGANQFLSYQSVVFSDLFIDLHPPKSFSNFNSIKYSDSLQHPIGSMVCQIYSGIFTRQISKNLLIVGAQGMEKSLLIQALAGETEFPLITDNAYRYSMVQQGVAVGIKLLRDVFDALALHTPCLFLLEDIHAIGERRPFLISDDQIHGADLLKNEFAKTGLDERNQIIYQLSKHVVSHFKKPYKGDFSLTIPTNQFCFEYLGNINKNINKNTKQNLLNSSFISYVKNQNKEQSQNNNFEKFITNNNNDQKTKNSNFASYLQLPSNQLLAPPATSPFSVLALKESRDTKNSAVVPVKEMPWAGLPGEQYSLINKASYSVRVKVALLADMAISNLSVKLDMITDLLVIIDSVKGNRGFAVFATTHVPSILDPALRRPGRLDETILVPKSSVNMLCRWEVFKSQFSLYNIGTQNSGFSRSITIDFSSLVFNTNQNLVKQNFVQNKLNLFAQFNSKSNLNIQSKQNLNKLRNSSKNIVNLSLKPKISLLLTEKSNLLKNISLARKNKNLTVNNKSYKNLVSRSYFVVSEKLISSLFNNYLDNRNNKENKNNLHDSKALELGVLAPSGRERSEGRCVSFSPEVSLHSRVDSSLYLLNSLKNNNSIYPILYAPPKLFKDYFVNFMAGKIGEMFLSTAYYNTNSFFNISPQKNLITQSSYGIDKTWRHISDFATQLIQKRYLYNQRLFSLSNIFFTNNSSFKEPPGPPSSNVLLPARRSFNYQRNFYSQISRRSNNLNIHEKIQLHQQQRLVKRLYGYSVQEFFFLNNEESNNTGTSFANAPLVLGKHDLILEKPSSSTWFYQKKILSRHKNYLTNQWWNAQLPEHNAETTFLSDIDWRYSFVDPGHSNKNLSGVNKKQNVQKSKTQDLFIDFPDSVQYYNPRNRRWVLAKNLNNLNNLTNNTEQIKNFVNIFDFSEFSQEIYSHFLFDAYVKAYNILNQNREILDYFASKKLTSACVANDLTDKLDQLSAGA